MPTARRLRPHAALLAALLCAGCGGTPDRPAPPAEEDKRKVAALNTQLAIEYMKDGDNELALKKLDKALDLAPNDPDVHNAMALLRSRLGQLDEAEKHFRAALRSDPGNSLALNNYGQFLCQQQRFEEGQARFVEAVKNPLYRTPEIALTNAGLCALQAQDAARAEEHFRAALEKNPQLPIALLQMGQFSYEHGDFVGAQRYVARFQAVAPQSARSLALGIRVENALGNRDQAASYELALRNRFPDSREAGQLLRGELR
jgi:type IV pilus assembly protein PilF